MDPVDDVVNEDAVRDARAAFETAEPGASRKADESGAAKARGRKIEPDPRIRGGGATLAGAAQHVLGVVRGGASADADARRAALRRAKHDLYDAARTRPALIAAVAVATLAVALLPLAARAARRLR
ncbi:MAG TPA: hypothetical protein VGC30_04020 [Dokdonella sp.]